MESKSKNDFAQRKSGPRILYDLREAANQISISVSTLEQLIVQGEIRPTRIGKRVLVSHKELERLAERDIQIIWPIGKPVQQVVGRKGRCE